MHGSLISVKPKPMFKTILFFFAAFLMLSCASVTSTQTTKESVTIDPDFESSDSSVALYTIPLSSKSFATDKLNQLYLITEQNEIIKYDSKGKEVFRYNNNFLENLSHVDATDPFNLLLYYPDYLSVITLDRTMNKTGEFDLSSLNLIRVKAVGSSNDNQVWLYDEVGFQLKKINRSGDVLRQSVDLNLQLNYPPKPIFLIEKENSIYVNDPAYGILIFNVFGEYESMIELKGINTFQIFDNRLLYKKGQEVFSYHLQTFDQRAIKLPVELKDSDEILIQKNRLFVRKTDRIEVYTL